MRGKVWQTRSQRFHFVRKGVNITVLRRVEPVNLRAVVCFRQRIQHRQHWRLTHACGDQRHRGIRFNGHKEIARRCRQMDHVAHAGFVMEPVGYLTTFLTFNRNAIAFAVWLAGQGVLANLLMREAFRLQPDAQILARLVIGNWLTINWLKLKAGDQCAARVFSTMRKARVPSQPPFLLAFSL